MLVVVHNLIVEDREVKGKTKSDWVAGIQGFALSAGLLVVLKCSIFDCFKLISNGAFSDISVVVTSHLIEESLSLVGFGNV